MAIVAIRAKYSTIKKIPVWIKLVYVIQLLLTINFWIYHNNNLLFEGNVLSGDRYRATAFGRFFGYLIIVYCFSTAEYIKTKTADLSRALWIIHAFLHVLIFTILMLNTWGNVLLLNGENAQFWATLFFSLSNLGMLAILLNHVFLPESVLFTKEQLQRAFELYPKIKLSDKAISDFGISRMKSYIDSLPPELVKELKAE